MTTAAKTPSQARPALRRFVARPLTALGAVVVVGLLAAACGSSTPNASSTTTNAPGGSPGTTGAASGTVVAKVASNATIGGTILVNSSGMTLYKLSADSAGTSACTSSTCVAAWPPLTVASGSTPKGGSGATGTFGTITRSDGTLQVTYDGHPLYTFSGDSAAGSAAGQKISSFGGIWTVVTTGGSTPPPAGTTATTKASTGGYGY